MRHMIGLMRRQRRSYGQGKNCPVLQTRVTKTQDYTDSPLWYSGKYCLEQKSLETRSLPMSLQKAGGGVLVV